MKTTIHTLLFLALCLPSIAQSIYTTEIYDSIDEDQDYATLKERIDTLNYNIEYLFFDALQSTAHQDQANKIIAHINLGNQLSLKEAFENDAASQAIFQTYSIDKTQVLHLADEAEEVQYIAAQIRSIYIDKELHVNHPDYFEKRKRHNSHFIVIGKDNMSDEVKKYDIDDKDKILELGAGSTTFAMTIGQNKKGCILYLNDIDTLSLKGMYNELHNDHRIISNIETRSNQYHLVRGTEISTGAEGIIFDKILLRNCFHHFDEVDAMLSAIKSSMDQDTELIVREQFRSKSKEGPCSRSLTKDEFQTMFKSNGLVRSARKKRRDINNNRYWIYKFKLP